MQNLFELISSKTYPGRGLVAFRPKGVNKLFCVYWIMGRSENSRNRVFEEFEGNIRTVPADASKVEDAHLIIYNARVSIPNRNVVILTNGDQTDTIVDFVKSGDDEKVAFMQALMTRTLEDDAPNFTPRISMMVNTKSGEVAFSCLKCANAESEIPQRCFNFYDGLSEGEGYLLTTYVDDSKILKASCSEPVKVACDSECLSDFKDSLWKVLNDDNKISLYVEEIDLETGKSVGEFVNKYEKVEA